MLLGYACINLSLECRASRTFRLASFNRERLLKTVQMNIDCLWELLEFNKENNIFFFRFPSDIVPFASHPINKIKWQKIFAKDFAELGKFIKQNKMRITMHPDQFVIVNAKDEKIFQNSVRELVYHAQIFDLMGLDSKNKIEIHVGGVYGEKEESKKRFVLRYKKLPALVKKYLTIENDDRSYSVKDCLDISKQTGIPITFDNLHHELNNNGESVIEALKKCAKIWKKKDGVISVHYSNQSKTKRLSITKLL